MRKTFFYSVVGILALSHSPLARADEADHLNGYSQGSIGIGFKDRRQEDQKGIYLNNDAEGKSLELRHDALKIKDGRFYRAELDGEVGTSKLTYDSAGFGQGGGPFGFGPQAPVEIRERNQGVHAQLSVGIVDRDRTFLDQPCHGYAAISAAGEVESIQRPWFKADFRNVAAGPELGLICQVHKIGVLVGANAKARLGSHIDGNSKDLRLGLHGRVNVADRALLKIDADQGKDSSNTKASIHVKASRGGSVYVGGEYESEKISNRYADWIGVGPDTISTRTVSAVAGVAW